jgi:hypothetical protein
MRLSDASPQPDGLLDAIPDPDTVRAWLARSIRQSALLRSLLGVSQRKASLDRQATASPERGCAQGGAA